MSYAVIDLETTGFSPAKGDRIVEIGVVLLDDDGVVEREWTTLVNPQRDVGATHVHGIRASDVVDAPTFADIAAHLVELLSGRALVAHNQAFDVRFLRAELAKHGHELPQDYAALCTMQWSRVLFGAAKLSDVCALLEIEHESAHAALGDAQAAAAVTEALIRAAGHTRNWAFSARAAVFPLALGVGVVPTGNPIRARVAGAAPSLYVDTAAAPLWERVSIPIDANDPAAAVYLDMLTQVLEDGLISTVEYSRLDAIAEVAHLGAERINALHAQYLAMARVEAFADGVISADERRELTQIATILDLPTPDMPDAVDAGVTNPAILSAPVPGVAPASRRAERVAPRREQEAAATQPTGAEVTLTPGARVVFTGTMSRPREQWAQAIAEAGFITGSVTKNCAVLVAQDPATQSGKAKTARAHGIPIITEPEFIAVFEAFISESSTIR